MGSKPRVLPSIALAIVIGAVLRGERIERSAPTAIGCATSHKLGLFVKEISPTVAAISEELFVFMMTQHVSRIGYSSIGNGIFHVVGTGFFVQVTRDITIFLANILSALVEHHRSLTSLISSLFVDAFYSFDDGLSHGNHAGITHHAVSFIAHEMPYGQLPLFIEDVQHRVD